MSKRCVQGAAQTIFVVLEHKHIFIAVIIVIGKPTSLRQPRSHGEMCATRSGQATRNVAADLPDSTAQFFLSLLSVKC